MKFFIILLLFVLTNTLALAYSRDTHLLINQAAVQEYNQCLKVLNKVDLPQINTQMMHAIGEMNFEEDRNLWIKAQNWHFYSPSKNLGKGTFGLGSASFQGRFYQLQREALSVHDQRLIRLIGQMSHYIQDVTNPAHVAPVYHEKGDGFDNYDFQNNWPAPLKRQECQELFRIQFRQPFDLVHHLALNTVNVMNEDISIFKNGMAFITKWSEAFWSPFYGPNSKQKGFGQYGYLDNSFGQSQIRIGQEHFQVSEKIYSDLAKKQVRKSINGTIILFANKLKNWRTQP